MRYYKDKDNLVYGFEDDIKVDTSIYTEISKEEALELVKPIPPTPPSEEELLANAKENKLKEIDAKRDEAIESGVTYKDKVFQSAEKDRNLLTSTVSLFSITKSLPEGFVWIAKDNTAVSMSLEDLIALGALMASSVNENTIKARNLKDAVLKATTLDEVKGIVWN
ncbi:DUF4376 domain-containing protein [Campylobacter sp. US33a]|uniref:DUF4376 domain-containing protein n=1 Tax=Campylobacter sp. US33a TaxID=2498120 RepID=UPI00106725BA|nr:DUF4376 domain-containing protein [Campylobacter sp. US33a]TEY00208.1 DUF4376 domain-containing protein [Campylobacter sp. US33a]